MTDEPPLPDFYTVTFRGNVREMAPYLFEVVEPFGEVVAIAVGNALDEEPSTAKEPSHD